MNKKASRYYCNGLAFFQNKLPFTSLIIVYSVFISVFIQSVCMCVLQEQWGNLEEIELMNDGSGLGFGIVGGKATGVVVRTIVPNSVADKVRLYTPYVLFHKLKCTDNPPYIKVF